MTKCQYLNNNLEILTSGEYSIYSDVFAFGMLMWEIASRNSRPFGNLKWFEIASKIKKGKRPIIPSDCPIQIKNLIERCWNQEAKQRPTTQQIIEYLENLNKPQNQYVDNSTSQVLNQQQLESPRKQKQYKEEIISSNSNDSNNNNNDNNKRQTLRMKQKQNLEIYLKEIGIEIEEEDEELHEVIDTFVSQKVTPNVLKLATIEDLKDFFEKFKTPWGFQTQLLRAIKASKVSDTNISDLLTILF